MMRLKTFKSVKYQTEISYYVDDIICCWSGEYACTGYGLDDNAHNITFDWSESDNGFFLKDVVRID